jgi:uncharacterized protein
MTLVERTVDDDFLPTIFSPDKTMITLYAKNVIRFRWLIIVATLIVVAGAACGLQYFSISNDYRQFFSGDSPQLKAFIDLQDTYEKSDNIMFVITPKNGEVFTAETLKSIQWLTKEAWKIPYSSRVDSISNFQHTRAVGDSLHVANLVSDTDLLSAQQLSSIYDIAVSDPQLVNRLINKEATVTGINVVVQLPQKDFKEVGHVASAARTLASKAEKSNRNIDVRLTGVIMLNNAFGESAEADMKSLLPALFVIVLVVLGMMLRSFSLTLCTLATIILSILAALGIAMWAKVVLNPVVMSAPTIIMTICVADAVHLLSSYRWYGGQGMSKNEAMVESIRVNMSPLFLTSMTTALGFLSMNFSEVPPTVYLGNIVAVGVLIAFVLSVTFLPAIATLMPFTVTNQKTKLFSPLDLLADVVVRWRKPLLWITLLVSVIFICLVPNNQINDEFVKYFDPSIEFRQDSEYASAHLIGPYSIEYSLTSKKGLAVSHPDYLFDLQRFIDHLNTYELTNHVTGLTDTIKKLNKNMHGDLERWYQIPDSQPLAAQYLLLYEMSLPYGLDLNNQYNISKTSSRVLLSVKNLSSKEILALEATVNHWVKNNLPDFDVVSASPTLMFAHVGQNNAKSLVFGTSLALVLISCVLIFALKSIKLGLISLIPNIVPAAIAFGAWSIIDGNIGLSVSIVAGMTLGIVVDDTVHFLSKYLRARRENGMDAMQAIRYTFNNVGAALITTSIVLISGFMVLSLSTFKLNNDMGLLTALTIGIALIVDFLLLPALLMTWDNAPVDTQTKSNELAHKAPLPVAFDI